MKLLFISILLMLSFNVCSAQSAYFDYKGNTELRNFLKARIRPSPVLMESCLMPFTYVKFKITKENTVDSLVITNNSVPDIKKEIARVITLTNSYWNVEQTKDRWIIVPLVFYTNFNKNVREKGCDYKKILAQQNEQMYYENKEINAIYFPMVIINSEWN